MREYAADRTQLHSRWGDEVVAYPQVKLAMDEHLSCEQQVEVLGYRSCQRVFNGNDRRLRGAVPDPLEHLRRPRARNHGRARQHLSRSFVAEGAELSLDRNFHLLRRA